MNWRYLIGDIVNRSANAFLSSPMVPLTRYVPVGQYWLYDVQRFAGTRDFSVVFDIGANIGQTAYGLVRYLPKAKIFCVEPIESTMRELKAKYSRYSNIEFVQLAFGSKSESIRVALHQDSELNTLVKDQPRIADLTGKSEMVSVETVDNFCSDEKINYIDILKLDVQGWELEVLRGSEELLKRNAVHFIFAEVGFRKSDTDMQYFSELHEFMQVNGFEFCGLYDTYRYGAAKQFISFANALYINLAFRRL